MDEVLETKEIPLTRGQVAIVDAEDYERVSELRWHAVFHHGNWYARANVRLGSRRTTLMMHRLVVNAPPRVEVDHKDRNGLNNTRVNLRVATTAQNQFNAGLRKNNTSGFRGVSVHSSNGKRTGLWKAAIKYQERTFYLGAFANKEEAALAYDAKAAELFGEFANLNLPTGDAI